MTYSEIKNQIKFLEELKSECCADTDGNCEECILNIETPCGNECPFEKILSNM